MNTIEFKKTSNIFINIGIVALHRYIQKYSSRFPDKYRIIQNKLQKQELVIECENLISLLEDVYYFMGKEIYDTVTSKQKEEVKNGKANYFYDIQKDEFFAFPKMNTYGLTHLLTNNAQGVTRLESNSRKIKNLEKSDAELAKRIRSFFESKNLKILSKVYFNEPYTKITRLEIKNEYLELGSEKCPIINESFKVLIEGKNISPFIKGLSNFNSYLNSVEKKISLKALYLLRFSPVLALYNYQNNYDTIICSFFNSDNLQNINFLFNEEILRSRVELEQINYRTNFNLVNFSYKKKDNEIYSINSSDDAVYPSEISFMLLYTFYKRNFEIEVEDDILKNEQVIDPFADHQLEKAPLSLVTFRADKFASTLRPNEYEEYNNVKFIIRLIHLLENNKNFKAPIKDIWRGLKLNTPKSNSLKKARKWNESNNEERKYRASIFKNILIGRSILTDIEALFYDSYKYKIANENTGFRNYKTLLNFTIIYERTIIKKYKNMDEKLQLRAIKLGVSIGQGIIRFNNENKKTNAKNGRKYIIGLHKSRTLEQFLENLYRIMNKYHVSVSNEILENINKDNFQLIRLYALISSLNQINSVL